MFTGLVQTLGKVVEVLPRAGSTTIAIASNFPHGSMQAGESVAVDGVCLTVTELQGDRFLADVVAETLSRTTLGGLCTGRQVNLERSLSLADRIGGHLVQGHVDASAAVVEVRRRHDDYRLDVEFVPQIRRYIAYKGSVTLQGVSLTVAALEPDRFQVALIPETLQRTTLGSIRAGDRLNVEVDLIARYLERLVQVDGESGSEGR